MTADNNSKTMKVQRANKIALAMALQSESANPEKPISYNLTGPQHKPCPVVEMPESAKFRRMVKVFNAVYDTVIEDCVMRQRDSGYTPTVDDLADAARKG